MMLVSVALASGGAATRLQHYTNIHRITCLAACHPLVLFVRPRKLQKRQDYLWNTERDNASRAANKKKCHQSPWDLGLELGSGARMQMGCSVRDTNRQLLNLWWGPGPGVVTAEMEDLARAVFMDVVEAAHVVPQMYLADFQAASGASPPAAPPALARGAWEAPPTYPPRGSSSGTPFFPSAEASAPSTSSSAAPSTSAAAWPTSTAAPPTSTAAAPAAAPAAAAAVPAAAPVAAAAAVPAAAPAAAAAAVPAAAPAAAAAPVPAAAPAAAAAAPAAAAIAAGAGAVAASGAPGGIGERPAQTQTTGPGDPVKENHWAGLDRPDGQHGDDAHWGKLEEARNQAAQGASSAPPPPAPTVPPPRGANRAAAVGVVGGCLWRPVPASRWASAFFRRRARPVERSGCGRRRGRGGGERARVGGRAGREEVGEASSDADQSAPQKRVEACQAGSRGRCPWRARGRGGPDEASRALADCSSAGLATSRASRNRQEGCPAAPLLG